MMIHAAMTGDTNNLSYRGVSKQRLRRRGEETRGAPQHRSRVRALAPMKVAGWPRLPLAS
jgi:hypothetical protein